MGRFKFLALAICLSSSIVALAQVKLGTDLPGKKVQSTDSRGKIPPPHTKWVGGVPPPSVGFWQRTTSSTAVALGASMLLTDGTVIVERPQTRDWWKLTPDAFGSYVNGTWSQIASTQVGYGPLYFASAVLADGRVVVLGGEYNVGSNNGVWTNKGSIYNPVTNVWTSLTGPGWGSIGDAQCSVMPDGRFLLASILDTKMAIMDPATLAWTNLAGTGKLDRFDEEGWSLMPDGTILTCSAINAPSAQRYIPSLDKWISAGSTPQSLEDPGSQELGPMVLRPDGTVFCMGATGHNAVYTPSSVLLDPGTWAAAPDFPIGPNGQLDIADGPACLLPNGNVLCYASPGVFNSPATFFEFDGTSLVETPGIPNNASNPSFVGNMLALPSGQILFTDFSNDVEIYTPAGGPNPSWKPTITTCPTTLAPGQTFILRGTQLNGLSQCSGYGDDSSNATNYPLVRITNVATGHVRYARTHDHSTMAVATGSAIVATRVDLPANLELGASKLEVVANGIPSLALDVTVTSKLVSGHVTLQGWIPSSLYTPVTVEIRSVGSTSPLDTQTILLDQNGNFQIATALAAGNYDITAKASHWLRQKLGNLTVTATGISGLSFSLLNGDIDGNNSVGLGDFGQLRAAYGTSPGGNADLDGNGSVGLSDFGILRSNYGLSGDQ